MLPGINGLEKIIKEQNQILPLSLLYRLGNTENVVNGLDNGADADYLIGNLLNLPSFCPDQNVIEKVPMV